MLSTVLCNISSPTVITYKSDYELQNASLLQQNLVPLEDIEKIKRMFNNGITLWLFNNTLDFYVQAKSTQNTPQVKKLNAEVGKKDKPLVIFWNAQEKREVNIISVGEYVILQKEHFYDLLKLKFTD